MTTTTPGAPEWNTIALVVLAAFIIGIWLGQKPPTEEDTSTAAQFMSAARTFYNYHFGQRRMILVLERVADRMLNLTSDDTEAFYRLCTLTFPALTSSSACLFNRTGIVKRALRHYSTSRVPPQLPCEAN